MSFETRMRKVLALSHSEAAGEVADSMEVRLALMARFHSGEITLQAAQAELAKIKSSAKKSGKVTRSQAYRRGCHDWR